MTVVVPFPPERAAPTQGMLQALDASFCSQIDRTGVIHFMSMTVVAESRQNQSVTRPDWAYLLIEFSADIAAKPALSCLVACVGPQLAEILRTADVPYSRVGLARFLHNNSFDIDAGLSVFWWRRRIIGLPFDGLPGVAVERVKQEEALTERIVQLDALRGPKPALTKLNLIREKIWASGDMKWAFEPLQARFLGPVRPPGAAVTVYLATAFELVWPAMLFPLASCASLIWLPFLSAVGVIALTSVGAAAFLGLFVAATALSLARAEASDPVDDTTPDPGMIAEILMRENGTPVNLLVTVSPIKPDWFRRLTLRGVLGWIGRFVVTCGRPGFLGPNGEIGTLHAGRWIVLPGTNLLMFIAHYDGSWLSYMQDFVDLQPSAPTAIWTNTVGFPKTRWLVYGGVEDGDRATRWFHNQQRKIDFVYASSPNLTLGRIRTNAAIRRGFATAETEPEAEAWLALFGGRSPIINRAPRRQGAPRMSDETDLPGPAELPQSNSHVPTLAYGPLSHRHYAACLVVQLQQDDPAACRSWLATIAPDICYGPAPRHTPGSSRAKGQRQPPLEPVLAVGFSASGLRKLGMDEADLDTFPTSYVDGMASPGRARLLGDAPDEWVWGDDKFPPDAVVLIYACDQAGIEVACNNVTSAPGFLVARRIVCEVRGQGSIVEPFGFRDGLSQPVLPGTHAFTKHPPPDQIVAPGEFVLGYADETGRLAPTPTVAAKPGHMHGLAPHPGGRADIGRDSTFLVIRQLQQHIKKFDDYITAAARQTGESSDHIAAKMMGRWRDGSSLVRHPDKPGGGDPDNDFRFVAEDPDGVACPKGAHIRRANPRDATQTVSDAPLINRHRLLRVGRPYVDSVGTPSGTLFMCLNADIERQFELIQQAWVQNGNFASLRDESDPLTGSAAASRKFTIPTAEGPACLHNLPHFVTMLGGGYFWLPGKSAVEFLVNM